MLKNAVNPLITDIVENHLNRDANSVLDGYIANKMELLLPIFSQPDET